MNNRRTILKTKPARDRAYDPAFAVVGIPAAHTPIRWTCRHHMDGSEITAYVMASNGLEIIAETRHSDGIDARANAELIVEAVNNHDRYKPVINDLVAALELCLTCESLTWDAEQEADLVLGRAKRMITV